METNEITMLKALCIKLDTFLELVNEVCSFKNKKFTFEYTYEDFAMEENEDLRSLNNKEFKLILDKLSERFNHKALFFHPKCFVPQPYYFNYLSEKKIKNFHYNEVCVYVYWE